MESNHRSKSEGRIDLILRKARPSASAPANIPPMGGDRTDGAGGETTPPDADPGHASPEADPISEEIERISSEVKEPGEGRHWYDPPYRVLDWLVRGWPRRILPARARRRVTSGLNFLLAFHQLDWNRAESRDNWLHNIQIPPGESVTQGGVWVVDFYPPSRYRQLLRSLERNGWDRSNLWVSVDGTNAEQVRRARGGSGAVWMTLGTIANTDASFVAPGTQRARLSTEFAMVELAAFQVERSLTAIVAFFRLSSAGQERLNTAWHQPHEPTMEFKGFRRPQTSDRRRAAVRATQAERRRIHDTARSWLAQRAPGVLSESEARQPVVDLTLFDNYNPEVDEMPREQLGSLDALGFADIRQPIFSSPQLPGVALVPSETRTRGVPRGTWEVTNCWGLAGQRQRVSELNPPHGGSTETQNASELAHHFDEAVRVFMLHLGADQYLTELERTFSLARDLAEDRHGRHSTKRLRELRRELLTTGLDVRAVARDVAVLYSRWWRRRLRFDLVRRWPPDPAHPEAPGREHDVIKWFNRRRKTGFRQLLEEEQTYREVLATVASLGSSIESSRTGRLALVVAAVSLTVAAATLLVTSTTHDSLWSAFVHWVT